MSGLKRAGRMLVTIAVVAAVVGCGLPQGAARQGGQVVTFGREVSSTEAARDYEREAGPMGGMGYGPAPDARDTMLSDRAQDYEREAGPMGGMDYATDER